MNPRWLRSFANGLVGLSAFDALVSLLDDAVWAATGVQVLAPVRGASATAVLAGIVASVLGMIATPRLPIGVFGPLALTSLWLAAGAAPLPLWIESPALRSLTGDAIQIAAVALAFAAIRRRNGGRAWWFDAASPSAPPFVWRRSLGLAAGLAALGPVVVLGYAIAAMVTWMEVATQGFLQFDFTGVSLADRRYARGSQEIRLVGMMHIGEAQAYRAIAQSFARESTIVLAEGVSDRDARLATDLQYGRAAQALGLSPQEDLGAYLFEDEDPQAEPAWPVVRHADVDAAEFSPQTIEWIRWAGRVWGSKDLPTALRALATGVRQHGAADVAAFQADVLDLRNAHLVGEIEAALTEYERVVVPWGALHLPAIESAVREWGFEETSRERHDLIAWRTIATALF